MTTELSALERLPADDAPDLQIVDYGLCALRPPDTELCVPDSSTACA